MKRQNLFGIIAVGSAVALVMSSWASLAEEGGLKAPQSTITIKGKKPVKFKHTIHLDLGLGCGVCHHDGEHQSLDAAAVAVKKSAADLHCVRCHNKDFANKKLQKPKNVFHARCRSCHKTGVDGKKGPTKCAGCHGKKKAIEGC